MVKSIYMITSVPCRACIPSIAGCSGGAVRLLTSHVTKGRAQCGGTIISRSQRGGAIKSTNKEQPGPGVRQTAVAI